MGMRQSERPQCDDHVAGYKLQDPVSEDLRVETIPNLSPESRVPHLENCKGNQISKKKKKIAFRYMDKKYIL